MARDTCWSGVWAQNMVEALQEIDSTSDRARDLKHGLESHAQHPALFKQEDIRFVLSF